MSDNKRQLILIVDDDNDIREVMQLALELEGYIVKTARNGQEALGFLEQATPHLIFLDVMMPVLNGKQFLERLKERRIRHRYRIILMTAFTEMFYESRELDVEEVIVKPFYTLQTLYNAIEKYARPGYITEEIEQQSPLHSDPCAHCPDTSGDEPHDETPPSDDA